jgi:hypothetical protein
LWYCYYYISSNSYRNVAKSLHLRRMIILFFFILSSLLLNHHTLICSHHSHRLLYISESTSKRDTFITTLGFDLRSIQEQPDSICSSAISSTTFELVRRSFHILLIKYSLKISCYTFFHRQRYSIAASIFWMALLMITPFYSPQRYHSSKMTLLTDILNLQ